MWSLLLWFPGLKSPCWVILCLFLAMLSNTQAEDVCSNCASGCDQTTGICRGTCVDRRYGEKCDEECSFCKWGCDKDTGKCGDCYSGTYGEYCNRTCGSKCNGCDKATGECESCSRDYYGDFCNKKCPSNCFLGCTRQGHCKSCLGKRWGTTCDKKCPENCNAGCNMDTGKCGYCKPSYKGDYCEIRCNNTNCKYCYVSKGEDVCYSCLKGYYGKYCEKNCSSNCWRDCYKLTGKCYGCKHGWFGEMCENKCYENCSKCADNTTCRECMPGFYGDQCENKCNDKCNKCSRDGHNCIGCVDRGAVWWISYNCSCNVNECWPNEFYCDQQCKRTSWFSGFDACCPCEVRHCANTKDDLTNCGNTSNTLCSPAECQPGYYGRYCSLVCNPHCGGEDHRCKQYTGDCLEPCEEGWHGSKCDIHCQYYYPHCTRCETAVKDKVVSVKCVDCEKGYYIKNFATEKCGKCANCVNDVCNVTNGICLEGCIKGYFHNTINHCVVTCENCIDEKCYTNGTCVIPGCKPGYYYRNYCYYQCPSNCLANECDAMSGECLYGCKPGFYGGKCYSKCKNCHENVCNRTSGRCFECNESFWGEDCKLSCVNCIDEVCTHPDGCRHGCKPGLYSKFCNERCKDNCPVCDQFTGKCNNCSSNEDKMCLEKQRMPWTISPSDFPTNGSCTRGMYGPNCDIPCPDGCSNENMLPVCDRFTGTCLLSGCIQGRYGLYCNNKCSLCSSTLQNISSCDRLYGYCTTCDDGMFGNYCEEKCRKTCIDNICMQHLGYCLRGCKPGWTGDICEVNIESTEESTMLQTVLAVVLPVIMFLIIAVATVICVKSRRKSMNWNATD